MVADHEQQMIGKLARSVARIEAGRETEEPGI